MSVPCDLIIYNVNIAPMKEETANFINNAAIGITEGKVTYIGDSENAPAQPKSKIDGNGQWLLPGFIDCHTHLVHAGNRSNEFDLRLQGVSYEEIAKQGGGINSTVSATRDASEALLLASAIKKAKRLLEEGVTCIEIKSGYGLDFDTECKMLRVAKSIEKHLPVNITTTYLGAHALPPEYTNRADDYIDFICETMIPHIAKENLADAVDVFCESIGFSPTQCQRVFTRSSTTWPSNQSSCGTALRSKRCGLSLRIQSTLGRPS